MLINTFIYKIFNVNKYLSSNIKLSVFVLKKGHHKPNYGS